MVSGRYHDSRAVTAWLLAFILLAPIAGCKKAAPPQRPIPLVTVAHATTGDVPVYLDEIANCTSPQIVAVHPQASGQITEVHFKDGDDLEKGQMLYTIDPRPYQAALDQAKAQLAQSLSQQELAKLEFERAQKLTPAKAMSKEDYETRQNAVRTSAAAVEVAQAAVEVAQVNLTYCFIHSPLDGRASLTLVDAGNVVIANSQVTLVNIEQLDPMYVDFIVTEQDLPSVRKYMGRGTLKTLAWLPQDNMNAARQGSLIFLDNSVQPGNGTVRLRASIPNKDHHFWPGQFVQVRLILYTLKDAVLVPSEASQISQTGNYVYVVTGNDTAELRPVKLGQRQGPMVVVIQGLKAGEVVVLTGQMAVLPGGKVRVQSPPRGAATGQAATRAAVSKPKSTMPATATATAPATNVATRPATASASAPAEDQEQQENPAESTQVVVTSEGWR